MRTPLAYLAATAGVAAGATGPMDSASSHASLAADIEAGRDHISAPDLAARIMRREPSLQVIDLRSAADYAQMHIPTARHLSVEQLLKERFSGRDAIVLYSDGGAHAAQGWIFLRLRGYRRVFVLREGLYEWMARVMEPRLPEDASAAERAAFEQAAPLSRFFGGVPLSGVPRASVPVGYWTGASSAVFASGERTVPAVRRRGC
jgi:rhodanese-related sulfurtransferase